MAVQIKEVITNKDLRRFIKFPQTLYLESKNWVPPLFFDEYNTLRKDKNPAFECCEARYWLAYQDGHIVGRIAGILNHRHIEKWNQKYLRFGWIDFIDDVEVSKALLQTVEKWAQEVGMTAVHGPLGFTDLDIEGMLIEGFNELGTLVTIYNHPYYPKHLEKMGYMKDIDWLEYEITVPSEPNEKIARAAEIVMKRNNLRLLDAKNKKELLKYAPDLFRLLDSEYQHLYGFVPLTEKQIDYYVEQYIGFVSPEFVPVVLDQDGQMIAFGIVLPSLSKALRKSKGRLFPIGFLYLLKALKKNNRADLYLVAVKKEYQGRGVNAILINKMNEVFNQLGIKKVESNPELETNKNVWGQWKFYETRQHKRRRCFIKHLY